MMDWDHVSRDHVLHAIKDYDRLGPGAFFAEHGFGPSRTYELVWNGRRYPHKAILGRAYELSTGRRLASPDFEGGKTGAVRVLGALGFTVAPLASRAAADRQHAHRAHGGAVAGKELPRRPSRRPANPDLCAPDDESQRRRGTI